MIHPDDPRAARREFIGALVVMVGIVINLYVAVLIFGSQS